MKGTLELSPIEWGRCVTTLRVACGAGADAAFSWIGRLNEKQADVEASRAIRDVLRGLGITTRVIAGEGKKDGVEHLAVGEFILGSTAAARLDLAVDPIEGTANLARGRPWALTVAAVTPHGGMFETGPSLYMDKLIVPAAAAARIDPEGDTSSRLRSLADALGKPISSLRVFVLDKPRNQELIAEVIKVGATIAAYHDADVVGTCAVALGEHFDAMIGIGGTPEGMLSACAVRALGGGFFARLTPQRSDEARAMIEAGVIANRWLAVEELVPSARSVFCAAGITDSLLAPGVRVAGNVKTVSSLTIEGPAGSVTRFSHRVSGVSVL